MERILLILALGLTAAEKLDRRYLPPPDAKFSGGNPEDLQTPLEVIKEEPVQNFDLEKNFGDNLNLQTSQIDSLSSSPITPLVYFPMILTSEDDYKPISRPVSDNLKVENLQHINDYIPKTSTQQQISELAPDGSINSSKIENGNIYKFNKETQPRQYVPNATIMQYNTINGDGNHDGIKFNETTLITEPKNQRPTGSNIIDISSPSKPSFPTGHRSKITAISTEPRLQRLQANKDKKAVILNYHNVITPKGFSYSYDTSNEISASESGTATNGVRAKGAYSYKGDDGKIYKVGYTADENGFRPYGDHLPTPPPVPEAIQRLIEKAAREKEAGISDDGSYDEAKYGYKNYHGAMERYHPEIQGITNFKGSQYSDYQNHKLGQQDIRRRPVTTSKTKESEINTKPFSDEYTENDSIVILAPHEAATIVKSNDFPMSVFKVAMRTQIKSNSLPNARNPYKFGQDRLFTEYNNGFMKPMELDKSSTDKNKQVTSAHFSQNALTNGNRDSNTRQDKNIPDIIMKSNKYDLGSTKTNKQDKGYIYVKPVTKFEEITSQNLNNERVSFDSDQELAIGDDDIITISVPLNISSPLDSDVLQTPATFNQYTTVSTQEDNKYSSQEIDYLDSSKIPLYFIDSTTMTPNINIDLNETLDIGRTSITPSVGRTKEYSNNISQPSEIQDKAPTIQESGRPIKGEKEEKYFSKYSDVTSDRNSNINSVLINNLGILDKGKLKTENSNNFADVDLQQGNSTPFKAGNNDGKSDLILRPTPTKRIIGEDFSGPRRPQSFDAITGYHY